MRAPLVDPVSIRRCVLCGRIGTRQFTPVHPDSDLAAAGTHLCTNASACRWRVREAIDTWELADQQDRNVPSVLALLTQGPAA